MSNGLGDFYPKGQEPGDTYFDIVRQGIALPRRKWIVKPEWTPEMCEVPGGGVPQSIISGLQCAFERHMVPRFWQLLVDFWQRSQCGTYFVKGPNHIEPPITAMPIDMINELPTSIAAATDTVICTYTEVPDRFVGSVLFFGHELVDPARWGDVIWNIKVNEKPIFGYQDFRRQRGVTVNPTRLAAPIILKHKDKVEVTGRLAAGGAVSAFARFQGFQFAAPNVDQTGEFSQYHTL